MESERPGDRVLGQRPGGERQRLEEHHHEPDVLDLAGLAGLLARADLLLDLAHVLEHPHQRRGESPQPCAVESQRAACEVGVGAIESAGRVGRPPVVVDLLQRRVDQRLLGHRRGVPPGRLETRGRS